MARSCTLTSLTACLVRSATSSGRSSSGPSSTVYSPSTASGSSGSTSLPGLIGRKPRVGRVGHGQPPARRVPVGEQVQPPVPARAHADQGVHALLEHLEVRGGLLRGGQVGDPHVVARRGTRRRVDDQPPAVPADQHAVVVDLVQAVAVDEHVVLGRGADPVQVDPAVELLLAGRDLAGRQPPGVVERLAAGQPGHLGVPAAVDGPVHVRPGGHVHDPQHGLLAAALRDLVGQQPALVVGLPAVQRGGARRVDRHRVDERPLGLARPAVRPGHGGVQHRVLLARLPPQVELAVAAPDRRADQPRVLQLGQPGGQPLAAGQRAQHLGPELVLRRLPGSGWLAVGVLQPAVGVGDVVAMQILVDVLAGGGGITHYGHEVHFIARIARLRGPVLRQASRGRRPDDQKPTRKRR